MNGRLVKLLILGIVVGCLLLANSIRGTTVTWVGGSGDWNTATNWSTGTVPGSSDNAIISVGGGITVTHSNGTNTVESLQSTAAFVLSGGILSVSTTFIASNVFTLSGGTLQGATLLLTNGSSAIVNSSGTFNGVMLNGEVDVGNTYSSANLIVTNGLVLNGTALVGNPTNNNYGAISFAGSQSMEGLGTVIFGAQGACNALRLSQAATALTIGPGITVEGQNGNIGYVGACWGGPQNVAVINQGIISCSVNNGTISIQAQPFENQALAQATNGGSLSINVLQNDPGGTLDLSGSGSLTLNGSWTNAGTVNLTNGSLNLGGTFVVGSLGVINRSNGTVNLTGTLTNTSTTLSLNAASGSWVLDGGTILGGSVVTSNGTALIIEGSSTINGVMLNGEVDVGNTYSSANLIVTNGLVLNGTALVGNPTNNNYGAISFAGSQSLEGLGTVIFGAQSACNALRLSQAGTTLTIGPGITVEGQNGNIGYVAGCWGGPQNVSVINQGVISCSVSNGTIYIQALPFDNQALAQATNGGSLSINVLQNDPGGTLNLSGSGSLTFNGSWTNAGTVNFTNGILNLGGTFVVGSLGVINRSNGTVNLTGTLTNTSTTLSLNTASGSWVLDGGTILGGSVVTSNGTALIIEGSSTINGVTLNGEVDVGNTYSGANLIVTNGLVLNGTALVGNPTNNNYGAMSFAGSQSLEGLGTVIFGAQASSCNAVRLSQAGTTLTIGPGITVEGQNGNIGYTASCWGGPQNVAVINQGTVMENVTGGKVQLGSESFTNQGSVEALAGAITANSGFVSAVGTLVVGLNNSNNYGQFIYSGAASLAGTLDVLFNGGFVPAISNSFAVVTYASFSGAFAAVNVPSVPHWQETYGATAFTLSVSDINELALVTGPGSTNAGSILAPVVVQIEDAASGSPVALSGVAVTIGLASGTGTVSGTLTRETDSSGKATFNDLSLNLVGTKTLQASASAAEITPVSSGSFAISPGPPVQLVLSKSAGSVQANELPFAPAPVVLVEDQFGNVETTSTAPVTARLASLAGGSLGGTTNINADGVTGSAVFTNLLYRLSKPYSDETNAVYFTSPGLTAATNSSMIVYFVFSTITLSNNNSVVEIDPTSEQGMFQWRVDGTNQVYQHWFWLRQGAGSNQISFDEFSLPLGLSYSSTNADILYLAPGLNLNLGFVLAGGPSGSSQSVITESVSILNTNNSSTGISLYNYADFDLAGVSSGDTVSFPVANEVEQQGKGMVETTIQTPAAGYWEGSWYSITLDKLQGGTPVTLSDELIPAAPGDQTFALQWTNTLGAGQTLAVTLINRLQLQNALPQPVAIGIGPQGVIVSWLTNSGPGVQLQSSTNLGPTAHWTNVTNVPAIVNGFYQVGVVPSGHSRFYRLKQ